MPPEHVSDLTPAGSAAFQKPWAALAAGVSPSPLRKGDPALFLLPLLFQCFMWGCLVSELGNLGDLLAGDPRAKAQHPWGSRVWGSSPTSLWESAVMEEKILRKTQSELCTPWMWLALIPAGEKQRAQPRLRAGLARLLLRVRPCQETK